jgi:hypothetical protein
VRVPGAPERSARAHEPVPPRGEIVSSWGPERPPRPEPLIPEPAARFPDPTPSRRDVAPPWISEPGPRPLRAHEPLLQAEERTSGYPRVEPLPRVPLGPETATTRSRPGLPPMPKPEEAPSMPRCAARWQPARVAAQNRRALSRPSRSHARRRLRNSQSRRYAARRQRAVLSRSLGHALLAARPYTLTAAHL